MHRGPFFLRRLGRKMLWRSPAHYRWFGRLRNRGDCLAQDYEVWIDGFPRSANTFAVTAFALANPGVQVRSHRHIPPFILQSLMDEKPGILLIRKPEDAVISWAIFWNAGLDSCLDYYLDFHRALRPFAGGVFVAEFEEVTSRFGQVIERFNQRFGTEYAAIGQDSEEEAKCFSLIEKESVREQAKAVNELRVCRPSPHRSKIKPGLLAHLRGSPALRSKLEQANELYAAFAPATVRASVPARKPGNTQAIPLSS